jgi:hypothetical protein
VREHGELRLRGRSGGGAENRRLRHVSPLHLLVQPTGALSLQLVASTLQLGEIDQRLVVVVLEAVGVVVDDPLDAPKPPPAAQGEQLVHLLLVLGNHHANAGVVEYVLDLLQDPVRVETDRHPTERLRGELRDQPLRTVVAEYRQDLAALEAERGQPLRKAADPLPVPRPRDRLPDPVALLLERGPLSARRRKAVEKLGKGQVGRRHCSPR